MGQMQPSVISSPLGKSNTSQVDPDHPKDLDPQEYDRTEGMLPDGMGDPKPIDKIQQPGSPKGEENLAKEDSKADTGVEVKFAIAESQFQEGGDNPVDTKCDGTPDLDTMETEVAKCGVDGL